MKVVRQRPARDRRSGIVLLAVLVVVAVLSLAAYRFSDLMLAEYQAVESFQRATQAHELANSGVQYAVALMASYDPTQSGSPYDNPSLFRDIAVGTAENARRQGRFSILAPPNPEAGSGAGPRYGVHDESGKINLTTLLKLDSSGRIAHDLLLKLPGMDEEKVNALLDWIDPDEQPRESGAEDEYYTTLNPSYRCKNGPLDSLEELLYVKGFSPQLVYGLDLNRNGVIDPDETDGSGLNDLGLSAYLTVYSRELNIDSTRQPRIYVNDRDLNGLYDKLVTAVGPELAGYIVAYRQYGPATSTGTTFRVTFAGASSVSGAMNLTVVSRGMASTGPQPTLNRNSLNLNGGSSGGGGGGQQSTRPTNISSFYELVNSQVSIPSSQPDGPATTYYSPMSDASSIKQYLPVLFDKLTTQQVEEINARINVTTAPREVLMTLPNLDEPSVQAILTARAPLDTGESVDPIFQTPAWLMTEANLPAQTLRGLERYITSTTQVYRVQVVGYFEGGGPSARVEAVIDTNAGRPRVVYYRDLTKLGKGFNLTNR